MPGNVEIIFFGSPRAVMFFKAQHEIPTYMLIACVGAKTETLLNSMGHKISFSGDEKGSIHDVADAFAEWTGEKRVLFPVSSRTLGTIAQRIPEQQREIVTCYDTVVVPAPIAPCTAYVFTSPSNVEGFFASNELPEQSTVIAWGKSTERALREQTALEIHTLSEPTFDCLTETLSQEEF